MEKSQNLKVLVPNSSGSAKNRKSKQNVNKPANFKSNYGMSTAMFFYARAHLDSFSVPEEEIHVDFIMPFKKTDG